MNTKKERREAAQKKAKQQKIIVTVICAVVAVTVVVVLAVYIATRPDSRVFAVPGPGGTGQHSVTLYDTGRFVARLFHNNNFSGTFVEDGGTLTFTHGATTTTGQIDGDEFLLPIPWRGTCRLHSHEIAFPLVR